LQETHNLQLKEGCKYLYDKKQTFGGMFVISKYPPRCPHSPQYPLDTVWKETSWTSLLMGGPMPIKTFQSHGKNIINNLIPVLTPGNKYLNLEAKQ
jgi:hypothetical protein